MLPVLLEIGKIKLYSFGTFIALGALAGGSVMYFLSRKGGLKPRHLFDAVLYALLFGLLGARVGYYFAYIDQFQAFWQILFFWQGGLLALGGLTTGFLTLLYFFRKERESNWKLFDIAALSFLVSWAIGKIGCHLSSCSLGRAGAGLFAISGTIAVDLISAVWAILLFAILFYVWLSKKLSDGVVFFLALEGFFLGELLIKTLKADFGEGIARIESLVYLGLVVMVYLVFWRLHGPQLKRQQLGATLRNLVFRRR